MRDLSREAAADVNAAVDALEAFDKATAPGATDPGLHSYRKHLTARQADKDMASSLNHYKRIAERRAKLEQDLAKAQKTYRKLEKPGPVDPPSILGADMVRDQFGWHKVIKVNAKTVTVETPYSWTDRIPHYKIIAVHKEDK